MLPCCTLRMCMRRQWHRITDVCLQLSTDASESRLIQMNVTRRCLFARRAAPPFQMTELHYTVRGALTPRTGSRSLCLLALARTTRILLHSSPTLVHGRVAHNSTRAALLLTARRACSLWRVHWPCSQHVISTALSPTAMFSRLLGLALMPAALRSFVWECATARLVDSLAVQTRDPWLAHDVTLALSGRPMHTAHDAAHLLSSNKTESLLRSFPIYILACHHG